MARNAVKLTTRCCALSQILAGNETSMASIKRIIKETKERYENPRDTDHSTMGVGETTLFVVTISGKEEELEKKLLRCKFKMMFEFKRRNATVQFEKRFKREVGENLKFWIYSITK